MKKISFKCLHCGRCCRTLLREIRDSLIGLGLSLEETKLFPRKLISPQKGIGYGGKDWSKPKHILTYQLNVNLCPHISKDNLCKIYDKRPLSCRAFPLIPMGLIEPSIAEAKDCRFVEESESKYGSFDRLFPLTPKKFKAPEEWQAVRKIDNQLTEAFSKHLADVKVLWTFNLKSNEWEIEAT